LLQRLSKVFRFPAVHSCRRNCSKITAINVNTASFNDILVPVYSLGMTSLYSELLGFWTLCIVRYSRNYKTMFPKLDLFPASGRGRGETIPTLSGPFERAKSGDRLTLSKGPNRVGVYPPPSPEDGNRSSFRNVVCFVVSRIPDDGQSPKNPVIMNIMHHRRNPLEST
jgi:hypothetical protein